MSAYRNRYRRPTPLDCLSADICLMVKEQIPVFILNSGARTGARTGATRTRLIPRKGYVMSSHYPLEELHGHFQQLGHIVPAPAVLPSSRTNHACTACSLDHRSPPTSLRPFPTFWCQSPWSAQPYHRERLAYSVTGPGSKTWDSCFGDFMYICMRPPARF